MSIFHHDFALPAEKNRGYLLLTLAIFGGLIPDTGSDATTAAMYCAIPTMLGSVIAVYWMKASVRRKIFLSLAASFSTFFLRLFTTWLIVGFNAFGHFLTAGWIARRAFFMLFAFQLLFPFLTLVPLHFLFPRLDKRKMNDA